MRATGKNRPSVRGYSSAGRAREWHSRGQGFDPPYLHHLTRDDRYGSIYWSCVLRHVCATNAQHLVRSPGCFDRDDLALWSKRATRAEHREDPAIRIALRVACFED